MNSHSVTLEMQLQRAIDNISDVNLNATQAFALGALRKSIVKKYVGSAGVTNEQCAAALEKFFRMQRHNASFEHLTAASGFGRMLKAEIASILYDPDVDLSSISLPRLFPDAYDLGPGANVGASTYDLFGKLGAGRLTSSSTYLIRLYRSCLHADHLRNEFLRDATWGTSLEDARISFVPKTRDVARVICTEPTCNMMAQKAIGGWLESCLKRNLGIDLTTQPDRNRRLACVGSSSGRWATIDLESASDTISLSFVEEFFPPRVVDLLTRSRSPFGILPDGRRVRFSMISTMGNAFTFPLQTIIFSAVVRVCAKALRPNSYIRDTNVFGDDIIVPSSDYELVCWLLGACGFLVNSSKSFSKGPFRESCGGDYYQGCNVRGVYIKSLETPSELYHAINSLRGWGLRHGISVFRALMLLRRQLHSPHYVPIGDPSDRGIWSTRRQAARFGFCCPSKEEHVGFDPHSFAYKAYCRQNERGWIPPRMRQSIPQILRFLAGRITACTYSGKPLLSLKPQDARAPKFRTRVLHTSVWPELEDWLCTDRWHSRRRHALAERGYSALASI